MDIRPGLTSSATLTVAEPDTALFMGSGDVPVLSTPRVVALAEQAACEAVAGVLDPGITTVGSEVQLTHLAASPIGREVTAEAMLESAEGRKLAFRVTVSDARGLVAVGRIHRVVVVRDRFLERADGDA
ncbi:MAG: thioesterase [Acidimicrobiia bacterium]|nr:thioesterase [Acidimicrobiia bacterium]